MKNQTLELQYLQIKTTIDNLKGHMKDKREKLNAIAETLLKNDDEYIFSTGDLVLKKPASHTATKIKQ